MTTAIHPAAFVDEGARLAAGVTVGPGAVIGPHVRIGEDTSIGSHALITGWTKVGRGCRIPPGAVLDSPPQDLKYAGDPSYRGGRPHAVRDL
jgi:UDP-N-acetylglucosamine acyltransferase